MLLVLVLVLVIILVIAVVIVVVVVADKTILLYYITSGYLYLQNLFTKLLLTCDKNEKCIIKKTESKKKNDNIEQQQKIIKTRYFAAVGW